MTKQELVKVLAEEAGCTQAVAGKVFDAFLDQMYTQELNITGWFKTEFAIKEAHEGRNPLTGETIQIAEKRVLKIKQGKKLKDLVNQ